MSNSYFIGIDPGVSGAFAVLNSIGEVVLLDSWYMRHRLYGFEGEIKLAVLEKVHSMPQQSVVAVTTFMKNAGHWEGVLEVKCWPYDLVTPQAWQKKILDFVPTKEPPPKDEDSKARTTRLNKNKVALKTAIAAFVIRRYPDLKEKLSVRKNWGMADAICMALYARSRMIS